jgi:hypothetical protein
MKDTRKLRFVVPTDEGSLIGVYGSEEKIGAITLDPDNPETRKFWAGKVGMYVDPDLFYLVRKRRAEAQV